uniref:C-type lectin domain-containing protein n=1 Tax=Panagrellus redivivus TaxID=6233 RepID=A0A7E4V2K8_PANRE
MIKKVMPFFTFVSFLTALDIINHSCHFPTLNTCLRINQNQKMNFNEMKQECEKFDLSMMPAEEKHFGKIRSVLWFRHEYVTQFPLGVHVTNAQERAKIESNTGLHFKNGDKTGWLVYNYLDNKLILVPLETKLPIVCWSIFKPRLQCPPGFKLIYPRLTCYGVITVNQKVRKWTNEDCKHDCRKNKSNLGSFHSVQEHKDYVKKLGLKWDESLWVGTRFQHDSNANKGKDHIAVRATAYNMDGSKWKNFENAFEDDEPNAFYKRSENCVEWRLYRGEDKSYNDLRCGDKLQGCVCESAPDQTNVQY